MRVSQLLAGLAFVLLVPGCIWLAYAGYWNDLYPYGAVPIAFGVVFAVAVGALFALLATLRTRFG